MLSQPTCLIAKYDIKIGHFTPEHFHSHSKRSEESRRLYRPVTVSL